MIFGNKIRGFVRSFVSTYLHTRPLQILLVTLSSSEQAWNIPFLSDQFPTFTPILTSDSCIRNKPNGAPEIQYYSTPALGVTIPLIVSHGFSASICLHYVLPHSIF